MKAIILAAGEGVRMRPLTLERPKGLVEVAGKSLLQRAIEVFPDSVDEIIIVVKYKGDMIREYFGADFEGKKITYIEQQEAKGTAQALRLTEHLLQPGERFFVAYADDLHDKESVAKMAAFPLALLVYRVADPRKLGVVIADEAGKVIDIEEKPEHPKSDLASIGVYLLDTRVFSYESELHPSGEYFLTSMIQSMAKEHDMFVAPSTFWFNITTPEDVAAADEMLRKQ